MEQTGNHVNQPRKKETLKISETGKIGKQIFNDIVSGIADLKAVKGRVYVEVNLEVQDEHIFKDDEIRKSKLVVEIELEGF